MSLKYNGKLISFAKELRKEAPPQENHLWYDFLSKYPVKFRRQVMIDNYIADFYCYNAKLVIEVDGSQHETDDGMQKDEIRTEKLEEHGLQVIRIPNRCIDKEFNRVCDYIDQVVKNNIGDA